MSMLTTAAVVGATAMVASTYISYKSAKQNAEMQNQQLALAKETPWSHHENHEQQPVDDDIG